MNFWYECCIVTRQWDPELTVSYGCYTLRQLTSVKIRTMHSIVMLPFECLAIITYQFEHWESKQFLCSISSQTLWVNFESVPLMTSTLYFWLWHCYGHFLPSYFTALLYCRSPEISLMTPHCWFSHVLCSLVILPIPLLHLFYWTHTHHAWDVHLLIFLLFILAVNLWSNRTPLWVLFALIRLNGTSVASSTQLWRLLCTPHPHTPCTHTHWCGTRCHMHGYT